jgi:hypothetical protein
MTFENLEQDEIKWRVHRIFEIAQTQSEPLAIAAITEQLTKIREEETELLPQIFDQLELREGISLDVAAQAIVRKAKERFAQGEMGQQLKDAA